jgi:undecaprenyl-diphosphatase
LFFALAICILFVSRGAGIFALLHAFFVVSLPRVYMGMHYPTDIVVGAAIGLGFGGSAKIVGLRALVTRLPMRWLELSPGTFYAFLFILTFLVTVIFDPVRRVGLIFFKLLELVIRGH